jgi:hypothetical protein
MVLSLLVGALDDWPIFYAVPLLCAHYLFLAKEKKKSFLIFPISAGLIFLLVVMLTLRVGPSYILELLYFYIANPTVYGVWSQSMTLTGWCRTVFSYHVELYTLPILILSLVWLIGLIFRLARRENLAKDVLVGILLLFGLLNIGLGWQRAGDPAHAFWASLSIPGLAVASALVLHDIYERFVARSGKSFYLKSFYLKGLFYMLLLVFAFYCTEKLYSLAIRSDSYYKFGMVINRNSTFDDLILMPYDSIQPTLKFYADRNLRDDVYDLADFYRLCYEDPQAGKLRYAVMTQTDAVEYPELYRFLDLAFDHKTDEDYVIFDLKSKKLSDEDIIKYLTLRKEQYNFWTATRKSDYEAAAVAGNFQHIQLTVGGETRRALALAPNSKVTFQPVSVLEGARLKFGIGVSDSYQAGADAATKFEIIVHSENQDHVLFSKLMDPKGNPGDTYWHDDLIDLSPFAGREIGITLSIEQASDTALDAAGWSDLEIVYD